MMKQTKCRQQLKHASVRDLPGLCNFCGITPRPEKWKPPTTLGASFSDMWACAECLSSASEMMEIRRQYKHRMRLQAEWLNCNDCGLIKHRRFFDFADSIQYCIACQIQERCRNPDPVEPQTKPPEEAESEGSDVEEVMIRFCNGCEKLRPKTAFATDGPPYAVEGKQFCQRCASEEVPPGRKPSSSTLHECSGKGCSGSNGQHRWSEHSFTEAHFVDAMYSKKPLRCARCEVREDSIASLLEFRCTACQSTKRLCEFSANVCKQHMQEERRPQKKCYDCQFPECVVPGCTARPAVPVLPHHLDDEGKWICRSHRFPPCSVCKITTRPPSVNSDKKFRDWTCEHCQVPKRQQFSASGPCSQGTMS